MNDLPLSTIITKDQIQKRVAEIGSELTEKFRGEKITAVCVLKSSFMFYSDLIRQIDTDISCEFFGASKYENELSPAEEVRLTLDLSSPIKGQNVLLIEGLVDVGLTTNYLKKFLEIKKPKTLTTIALLYKPHSIKEPCSLDHIGFEISDTFIVGYGLGYQEQYRNLPYIAQDTHLN